MRYKDLVCIFSNICFLIAETYTSFPTRYTITHTIPHRDSGASHGMIYDIVQRNNMYQCIIGPALLQRNS